MKERFIIFETDANPYHTFLIKNGIQKFLEPCPFGISFLPLTFREFKQLNFSPDKVRAGIIGWFRAREIGEYFSHNHIPYINLFESDISSNIDCCIRFDGEGAIAADFFIKELEINSLGFIGMRSMQSSLRRGEEYTTTALSQGIEVQSYILKPNSKKNDFGSPHDAIYDHLDEDIHQWLLNLPKPAGIFCANEHIALILLFRARKLGFSIPDEISILGVGSTPNTGNEYESSISIVHLDHSRQGAIAAQAMAEYLESGKVNSSILIQPDGIMHRITTTRLAVKDSLVRKATALIQKDTSHTIDSLCEKLHVSRRALERRFRSVTGLTIAHAIDFERFSKAKLLIRHHDHSYEVVARLAGYSDTNQMRRSFHRFVNMNPRQYKALGLDQQQTQS